MPFSRYLGDDNDDNDDPSPEHDPDALDHSVTFSTNVQFQLPQLILNAPAVPPGGGAEALPAGFYPPSSSLSWFASPEGYSNNLCVLFLRLRFSLTLRSFKLPSARDILLLPHRAATAFPNSIRVLVFSFKRLHIPSPSLPPRLRTNRPPPILFPPPPLHPLRPRSPRLLLLRF